MNYQHDIQLILSFAKGLTKMMGGNTEIAIHDLLEKRIIYIENGYITNRTIGYHLDDSLAKTIIDLSDNDGHLIGFGSNTKDGRPLRTSHFIFKDEHQQPYAILCVNQDITAIKVLRDELDTLLNIKSIEEAEVTVNGENYVQSLIKQLIFNEIEQQKPTPIDSKETKLAILRALDKKGVFDVKDSVSYVCERINISQATLYNYLREIRNDGQDIYAENP